MTGALNTQELGALGRVVFDMEDPLMAVRELNRALYNMIEHMDDDRDAVAAMRLLALSNGFLDKVFEARSNLCTNLHPFMDFSAVVPAEGERDE